MKKILSLETIEAQSGLALPDRELLHASTSGLQYLTPTQIDGACKAGSFIFHSSGVTVPDCILLINTLRADALKSDS